MNVFAIASSLQTSTSQHLYFRVRWLIVVLSHVRATLSDVTNQETLGKGGVTLFWNEVL